MGRWWLGVRFSAVARNVSIGAMVIALAGSGVFGQEAPTPEEPAPTTEQPSTEAPPPDTTAAPDSTPPTEGTTPTEQAPPQAGDFDRMEADFSGFLQYAIVGRFDMAAGVARSLLQHPDLNPLADAGADQLLKLSDKYETSLDTLLLLLDNPKLSDDAKKILDLVYEAHRRARMDPARIKENIARLGGEPSQQAFGMDRLIESGEYAIPWMLEALVDPAPEQVRLQPFIVQALPQLGKAAVNPLVQALSFDQDVIQKFAAQALGRIGYPQALPYLKRLTENDRANGAVKETAAQAIRLIVAKDPGLKGLVDAPASAMFAALAGQYYDGAESVGPDPRENKANVWFPGGKSLMRVEVLREIYNPVMCMRCCEASLELNKDQPPVAALWVAANFRREAQLGLDVQLVDPAQTEDLTRPPDYPRSIYFAHCAGPDVCRMVLARALQTRDRNVALGAIAALNVTAEPTAMTTVGTEGTSSLVEALAFPDQVVRTRAALAIERATPRRSFRGAEDVVRVLAAALALTGKPSFLLIEPDATVRDQLTTALAQKDATVVATGRLEDAISRATAELPRLDGIFIASDLASPHVLDAVRSLSEHERFSLTPVMVYVKKEDNVIADRLSGVNPRTGVVFVVNGDGAGDWPKLAEAIMTQYPRTAAKYGYAPLTAETGLKLAMDAAGALRALAAGESSVFDVRPAERLLVEALGHESEELRIACLRVLALLDSATAQRAIAAVALSEKSSEALRLAAFACLADSGRHFGSRLEPQGLQELVQQALKASNLVLRTGASQALGALRPPGTSITDVIMAEPTRPVPVAQSQPAQQ